MVERQAVSGWRVVVERLDDLMLVALVLVLLPTTLVVIGAPVALVVWLLSKIAGVQ